MKQKPDTNTEQGHSANMLLYAVAPTPKLSTDAIALDSVSVSRGNGIGAIKEACYKGTRILLGNEKRNLINRMIPILLKNRFVEISIPIIQMQEIFVGKVGEENNNLMFNFTDRGNRNLCLAPEYTAVVQRLSKTTFKGINDVKIFYVQECFRGEKPQAGRFRQFTQLGVEILNPSSNQDGINLGQLAMELCNQARWGF